MQEPDRYIRIKRTVSRISKFDSCWNHLELKKPFFLFRFTTFLTCISQSSKWPSQSSEGNKKTPQPKSFSSGPHPTLPQFQFPCRGCMLDVTCAAIGVPTHQIDPHFISFTDYTSKMSEDKSFLDVSLEDRIASSKGQNKGPQYSVCILVHWREIHCPLCLTGSRLTINIFFQNSLTF